MLQFDKEFGSSAWENVLGSSFFTVYRFTDLSNTGLVGFNTGKGITESNFTSGAKSIWTTPYKWMEHQKFSQCS